MILKVVSQQVTAVCHSCFYQLHQLKSVQSSLTGEALHSLIQVWLLQLCAGWSGQSIPSETSVCAEHACSYGVWSVPTWSHHPSSWRSTSAIPVSQRVLFKMALMVWKCAPAYLSDLCVPATAILDCHHLRPAATGTLLVPRAQTATGQRSFAVNGPATWNHLPLAVRSPDLSPNLLPDINILTDLLTYFICIYFIWRVHRLYT